MRIMHAKILKEIPMDMLLPHERQALKNHGQSLHRLNDRGGLGVCEALAILEDRPWRKYVSDDEAEKYLIKLVDKFKEQQ